MVGEWRADGGRGGEVTLIWGTPLVRGALAATAELDGEVLDQAAVNDGRFTLMAVDAVHGFGDDLFLEIKLWDRRCRRSPPRASTPTTARRRTRTEAGPPAVQIGRWYQGRESIASRRPAFPPVVSEGPWVISRRSKSSSSSGSSEGPKRSRLKRRTRSSIRS